MPDQAPIILGKIFSEPEPKAQWSDGRRPYSARRPSTFHIFNPFSETTDGISTKPDTKQNLKVRPPGLDPWPGHLGPRRVPSLKKSSSLEPLQMIDELFIFVILVKMVNLIFDAFCRLF